MEVSHRCCAVLVLTPPRSGTRDEPSFGVAYEVRSSAFAAQFEGARFPGRLGPESALGAALLTGRRYVKGDGLLLPDRDCRRTECGFQTFRSSRSAFALVFPLSETMRRSRKNIRKKVVRM